MTETWLSFATRRPGPAWKVGYGSLNATALTEKEGEVKHSMEGTLRGALAVLDGPSFASWPLSIPKVGPPLQHYPLEALTWHAGIKGDRRQDTSLIGNLTLIGEEHEDYPTNALNANQVKWTTRISEEVRRLCPRVAARPPTLRVNLWEHNWLSATSCPSGLIPWAVIIAGLQEGEEMALDEVTDKATFKRMLTDVLSDTIVQAKDGRGVEQGGRHRLYNFLNRIRKNTAHGVDAAKHAAGGISETRARAIAREEDAKLKVTK